MGNSVVLDTVAATATRKGHHLPAIISGYLAGKKRFLLSKLNVTTRQTITSKWSVAMMEMFLSLKKYPALCELKLLGAS